MQQVLVLNLCLRFRVEKLHVVDLKVGAVGGHPGTGRRSDARRQVATDMRRAVKNDLRRVFFDQRLQNMRVRRRREARQIRIVDDVNLVDAVRKEGFRKVGDAATRENRPDFNAEFVGQFASASAKFENDVLQLAVFLFRENPNFAFGIFSVHSSILNIVKWAFILLKRRREKGASRRANVGERRKVGTRNVEASAERKSGAEISRARGL